eukprot:TRINITY_DN49681_c0_g1_i1.p1 TRINITY_DN49681_c0_g1~~TRINITY_DN49681_c0_g1_i1.p1  ORF type:complete len:203 (+),score=27.52 TRINITY_DN49681_c0_g1_i1:62-610(+)
MDATNVSQNWGARTCSVLRRSVPTFVLACILFSATIHFGDVPTSRFRRLGAPAVTEQAPGVDNFWIFSFAEWLAKSDAEMFSKYEPSEVTAGPMNVTQWSAAVQTWMGRYLAGPAVERCSHEELSHAGKTQPAVGAKEDGVHKDVSVACAFKVLTSTFSNEREVNAITTALSHFECNIQCFG